FVSHDRYFINKAADRILHLDHRQIRDFHGNYDYYLEKCREEEARGVSAFADDRNMTKEAAVISAQEKPDAGKADWKEQKAKQAEIRKKENRLRAIEEAIMQEEEALEKIEAQYLLPEVATNSAKLNDLSAQQKEHNDRLEELYAEWESLED
ncbi:MAG: ABC transporter ATP-binding protein, partial [Eubacterium sp.]|nr:ABC transporter ATP-binding protein [Eubacterium sp.]